MNKKLVSIAVSDVIDRFLVKVRLQLAVNKTEWCVVQQCGGMAISVISIENNNYPLDWDITGLRWVV